MDWTTVAISVVGAAMSIGIIATFMAKYMPTVSKWSTLAKDAIETLADLSGDLAKGPLTADEIVKLQADVAQFKTDLAMALNK